jgi:hypothetical protein
MLQERRLASLVADWPALAPALPGLVSRFSDGARARGTDRPCAPSTAWPSSHTTDIASNSALSRSGSAVPVPAYEFAAGGS